MQMYIYVLIDCIDTIIGQYNVKYHKNKHNVGIQSK